MKLFTIGDSISQGFMSNAAARTDLCYSSIIAEQLGMIEGNYHIPNWPKGGLPLNLERLFRKIQKSIGVGDDDISLTDWPQVLSTVNGYMDQIEDYYEREWSPLDEVHSYFHNVSVRGFNIADAWKLTANSCLKMIGSDEKGNKDNFNKTPSKPLLRTAAKVLNPQMKAEFQDFTQLDWLEYHAKNEGVENLFLWLGNNCALSALVDMKINQTSGDLSVLQMNFEERRKFNLWHVDDFKAEFESLIGRIMDSMRHNKQEDYKIFVGNVPALTILPIARGLGTEIQTDRGKYYEGYTYFPFDNDSDIRKKGIPKLSFKEAYFIDDSIIAYNKIIEDTIASANENLTMARFELVDIHNSFNEMAAKRNNGVPKYEFPTYVKNRFPLIDTKYYLVDDDDNLREGGIFSLDGVHPSAIGQGLIAYEFLKVMKSSGRDVNLNLPWEKIYQSDSLYSDPIALTNELFEFDRLKRFLIKFF